MQSHAPLGCTNDFSYRLFKALYIVITSAFGYMSYFMNNLGCQQADFTGLRLLELKLPYKLIIHSTMTRARETANHIHKHLEGVPMAECNMLEEGAPFPPEPPLRSWKPDHKVYLQKMESSKRCLECHLIFISLVICLIQTVIRCIYPFYIYEARSVLFTTQLCPNLVYHPTYPEN